MPAPIEPGTERLLLRPWRATDRAPFAALNADAKVMRHVDDFDHPLLPPGHALLRHRRYRITAAEFRDAGEHS